MTEHRTVTIRRVIGNRALKYQIPARGLISAREAASVLCVTLRWIYSLIEAERLVAVRRRGRVLVSMRTVLAYAKAQPQHSRSNNGGRGKHGSQKASGA